MKEILLSWLASHWCGRREPLIAIGGTWCAIDTDRYTATHTISSNTCTTPSWLQLLSYRREFANSAFVEVYIINPEGSAEATPVLN